MSVVDMNKVTFDNAQAVTCGDLSEAPVSRNLEAVAFEINVIKQQTAGVIARSIFEIGKRLCEAKAMIGHGNWEAWLRDNVEYSETNARNLMRAYREMGGEQIDLLTGEAPCDVFETLNLSQMVALFPLPAHERAAFVKENDVASMSVREVEERVREAVAQEKARADALEGELAKATEATERAENARQKWNEIAGDLQKEKDEAKIKHEADVRKLREQADKLKAKIKKLEDAPVQEKIVYVEKEAEQAAEMVDSEAQARVDALQAQLDEVQGKLKAAEDKAALMAQKADPRVQAVNFALRDVAEKVAAIGDAIDEIRGGTTGDGELADKLAASATKAIKAMLEGAGWYQ